jgi:hypothetical protein
MHALRYNICTHEWNPFHAAFLELYTAYSPYTNDYQLQQRNAIQDRSQNCARLFSMMPPRQHDALVDPPEPEARTVPIASTE